jgi:hypothetical protein
LTLYLTKHFSVILEPNPLSLAFLCSPNSKSFEHRQSSYLEANPPSPTSSICTDTPPELSRSRAQSRRRPSHHCRYQCNFCTESFKAKQNWQQHEAAFHLPLQRLRCSRQGPLEIRKEQPARHHPRAHDSRLREASKRSLSNVWSNRDNIPTPFPQNTFSESPQSAYQLIVIELLHYSDIHIEAYKKLPTSNEMRFEACRILSASEGEPGHEQQDSSWLRDLIQASSAIASKAKSNPRFEWENELPSLQVSDGGSMFEGCPFESKLRSFVRTNGPISPLSNNKLQDEATRIILQAESQAGTAPNLITSWLIGLIHASTDWLTGFRERAGLPRESEMRQ